MKQLTLGSLFDGIGGFPLCFKAESTKLYDEVATTLCNGTRLGYCNGTIYALDRASFNQGVNAKMDFSITNDEINSPLVASRPSAVAYEFKRRIVRRLTPTECERLQGFTDRWTETPKIESLSDNEYTFWLEVYKRDKLIRNKKYKTPNKQRLIKWYNKLDCDGNRYKMLGNSLAMPCVFYILNNIVEL
jgi:DNA (cytosine-5)-methyltransferase 1